MSNQDMNAKVAANEIIWILCSECCRCTWRLDNGDLRAPREVVILPWKRAVRLVEAIFHLEIIPFEAESVLRSHDAVAQSQSVWNQVAVPKSNSGIFFRNHCYHRGKINCTCYDIWQLMDTPLFLFVYLQEILFIVIWWHRHRQVMFQPFWARASGLSTKPSLLASFKQHWRRVAIFLANFKRRVLVDPALCFSSKHNLVLRDFYFFYVSQCFIDSVKRYWCLFNLLDVHCISPSTKKLTGPTFGYNFVHPAKKLINRSFESFNGITWDKLLFGISFSIKCSNLVWSSGHTPRAKEH